uniref:Inositol-1-monophosphatase n=1 Tax=Strigamia maritima TaxID=126957 RepID=T1IJ34_STRMM
MNHVAPSTNVRIVKCGDKLRIMSMLLEGINFEYYLTVAVDLAKKAGEICRDGAAVLKSAETKEIHTKSTPIDLVTEYDRKVEEFLFNELRKKFPHHKFIGEETASDMQKVELTSDATWVIDPIDGTMNFVHSFPYSAISIGFMLNKKLEVGLVYHFANGDTYTALRGKGAYLNGEKMEVSHQEDFAQALIGSELGSHRDMAIVRTFLQNFEKVQSATHGYYANKIIQKLNIKQIINRRLRLLGSAALNMCQVARGSFDAYYEFGIHIWDIAAGTLIVQEAGGIVIDPSGEPIDLWREEFYALLLSQWRSN